MLITLSLALQTLSYVKNFLSLCRGIWDVNDGLSHFFGLQIKQCKSSKFVNQEKYIAMPLKGFGLLNSKLFGTPISPFLKLDFDPNGKCDTYCHNPS